MTETISKAHLVDKGAENTRVSKKDPTAVVEALFEHMSLQLGLPHHHCGFRYLSR